MIYCEIEGRFPFYNSEHSCKSVFTGLKDSVSEQQAMPSGGRWIGRDGASFPGPQEANKRPQVLTLSQGAPPQPGHLWLVSLDPGVVLDEAGTVISRGRVKDLVPLLLAQGQPGSSVASRPAASLRSGSGDTQTIVPSEGTDQSPPSWEGPCHSSS